MIKSFVSKALWGRSVCHSPAANKRFAHVRVQSKRRSYDYGLITMVRDRDFQTRTLGPPVECETELVFIALHEQGTRLFILTRVKLQCTRVVAWLTQLKFARVSSV